MSTPDERVAPHRWDRALKAWGVVVGASWLVLPFLAAGTMRWAGIWIYMATIASGTLVQRVRTALEDATLRRELAGYAEYARRVRFRLLPGVW